MKPKTKKSQWAAIALTVLIAAAGLFLLQKLLVPKYVDDIVEGAFIAEYYGEERKDFDLLFIGDCEVYENFSPALLWKEYGISSYIRGSAEQDIWQSYYLLEDTLRYGTPKAVVFNVRSLKDGKPTSEAYNRMTLEGMKWSPSKVKAILASMTKGEEFLDYVFPILRYHTRWSELGASDLKYMFRSKPVTHNGYYMRVDVLPVENLPAPRILGDYSFSENAWSYLDKMTELCRKNDIELILVKAPSVYPHWYEEWEAQVEAYAGEHDLLYINFLEFGEETGIDYSTDTYDAGLHLNLSGAEKLTRFFGKILAEKTGLPNRSNEPQLCSYWEKKLAAYESEIQTQYERYNMGDNVRTKSKL